MLRVITTNLYPATEMETLRETYYGDLSWRTKHRMSQDPNNIIKQDHRFIKMKINLMLGLKSRKTEIRTISGIEFRHMVQKGQDENIRCARSEVRLINKVISEAA